MNGRKTLNKEQWKTVASYHVRNVFNHILFCRQEYRILNNDKTENNNWLRYWGGRRSSHHDGAFQNRYWRHRYHVCKRKRGYWKRLQKHPACSQDMRRPTCMLMVRNIWRFPDFFLTILIYFTCKDYRFIDLLTLLSSYKHIVLLLHADKRIVNIFLWHHTEWKLNDWKKFLIFFFFTVEQH